MPTVYSDLVIYFISKLDAKLPIVKPDLVLFYKEIRMPMK